MEGVHFLVDEAGHKTAVQIDLQVYGELWEDIHDALLAESRKDEPRESLQAVKARLRRSGRLPQNG
jgi:hypothetical protein